MAKVKILFLASDPFKTRALALDREVETITAQVRSAEYRDSLELVSAWAVRPDKLHELLLHHKPHVVHFSGHGATGNAPSGSPSSQLTAGRELIPEDGDQAAHLILMGDRGQPEPLSQEALVGLFKVLKDNIRIVVLNACHSKSQAEAIAEVIDFCVGMNAAIGDEAAIAFSAAFYRGIGFGRNLQEAFDLGKNALMNLRIPEGQSPHLYSRNGAKDPMQVVLVGPAPSRSLAGGADRNRSAMIEKVRTIWITGFLEKSLLNAVRVALGLNELPDAVARPLDRLVKRPDHDEQPLPSGTPVVDVFDQMVRSLLILGAPGAGKTTLLLELARDLLDRATQDSAHPIPVVFPPLDLGQDPEAACRMAQG